MESRFNSPYRHWIVGLLVELGLFVAFMLFVALVALIASWLA